MHLTGRGVPLYCKHGLRCLGLAFPRGIVHEMFMQDSCKSAFAHAWRSLHSPSLLQPKTCQCSRSDFPYKKTQNRSARPPPWQQPPHSNPKRRFIRPYETAIHPEIEFSKLRGVNDWNDLRSYINSKGSEITSTQIVSAFVTMSELSSQFPIDLVHDLLGTFSDFIGTVSLDEVSEVLMSCSGLGYFDVAVMEKLAQVLLVNMDFASASNKQLTEFIFALGKMYERHGVPVEYAQQGQQEYVDDGDYAPQWASSQDRAYAAMNQMESLGRDLYFDEDQEHSGADSDEPVVTFEPKERETDPLVNLELTKKRTRQLMVSTDQEVAPFMKRQRGGYWWAQRDKEAIQNSKGGPSTELAMEVQQGVVYDRQDDDPNVRMKNAQMDLIRLMGHELVEGRRVSKLDPDELYKALYGFCLMRYKRDSVMRRLTQALRLPEFHKNLDEQKLVDIVLGLSEIRYRFHRTLRNIYIEILNPDRLVKFTPSQLMTLLRGFACLHCFDEQFFTTVALHVRPAVHQISGSELVWGIASFAKAEFRDRPILQSFMNELEDGKKFKSITNEDLVDLMFSMRHLRFWTDGILKLTIRELANKKRLEHLETDYLSELFRYFTELKEMKKEIDSKPVRFLLNEILKPERLVSFSETALVSVMQGVGKLRHRPKWKVLEPLFAEVVSEDHLHEYDIRQISEIALSLALSGCKDSNVWTKFWVSAREVERSRTYRPAMLVTLFKAIQITGVKEKYHRQALDEWVFRFVYPLKMSETNHEQFVSVLECLAAVGYRDRDNLRTIFKEFIRPSKTKYLNNDGLASVMDSIMKLKYSERYRAGFLADEIAKSPGRVAYFSDDQLTTIWKGMMKFSVDNDDALRRVRREMQYRGLSLEH